jgi:hypothetical protein
VIRDIFVIMDAASELNHNRGALSLAKDGLERLGFAVAIDPVELRCHGVSAIVTRRRERYAVAWTSIIPFRRHDLRGALADAALRLGRACRGRKEAPLVAIVVERIAPTAVAELESYMQEYAPRVSWLIVDRSLHARWNLGGRTGEAEWSLPTAVAVPDLRKPIITTSRDPYAPAFQWLLKILLLSGIDRRLWAGPDKTPTTVAELTRASGVSQPQVSAFVKQYEEAGTLSRGPRGFAFAGVRRILDAWSISVHHKLGSRQPVGFVYPVADREKAVRDLLARVRSTPAVARYAIGSHLAAHMLGLGRSNVRSLRLYVREPVEAVATLLDLVPADADQAALELVRPRARAAIFEGAPSVRGTSVVDVLQCYLDVSQSPTRGAEQAEHLFERVLAPWFKSRGWL